jgi:hypothetical protein
MTTGAQRRAAIAALDLERTGPVYSEPLLHLLDEPLIERLLSRMVATTMNSYERAAHKLSNCLAYLLARCTMEDPGAPLVANLGPDEAWHVFLHFTREYTQFCHRHAGEYLHHDPAGEAAFVNRAADTVKTLALFHKFGIPHDPALWRDHELYPHGARAQRGGFVALHARPVASVVVL